MGIVYTFKAGKSGNYSTGAVAQSTAVEVKNTATTASQVAVPARPAEAPKIGETTAVATANGTSANVATVPAQAEATAVTTATPPNPAMVPQQAPAQVEPPQAAESGHSNAVPARNVSVASAAVPQLKSQAAGNEHAIPAGLTGLVAVRARASIPWLAELAARNGYSIQLYAVGIRDVDKLQEYLEFLELNGMLQDAYLCRISATGGLKAQWLILHELFAGYSDAEIFIKRLPPYMAQHQPYVRNVQGSACTN